MYIRINLPGHWNQLKTVAIKKFDIFLKGSHGQTAWSDPVLPAKLYQQHPCKF